MRATVFWSVVAVVTVICVLVVSDFSGGYRVISGILIFSVLPSVPIYLWRERYEKSVASMLERREEKLDSAA